MKEEKVFTIGLTDSGEPQWTKGHKPEWKNARSFYLSELKKNHLLYIKDGHIKIYNSDDFYDKDEYPKSAEKTLQDIGAEWLVTFNFWSENFTFKKIYCWANRQKATSPLEAMKYLANKLGNNEGNFSHLSSTDLKDIAEYANEHEIPLSIELLKEFSSVINTQVSQWMSSSYC